MKQMKKLMIFKANSNTFASASIFNWEHVLYLQLDENELTLFPKEVKYLIALQHLSIARNKIQVSNVLKYGMTYVFTILKYNCFDHRSLGYTD